MTDLPRHLVGLAVMLLAAAVIGALFVLKIPPTNSEIAFMVLGAVMTWAGSVVQFHFGSSQGSKDKTEHLAGGDR